METLKHKSDKLADTVFYIFDYTKMESDYGLQAFNYIYSKLIESKGTCVFCHGDLDGYGGPSGIPKFLRQLADQGSVFPNVSYNQLAQLDSIPRIYGYAVSMWTDSKDNILNLHERLVESNMSYLGAIRMNIALGSVEVFFSEMNRFILPQALILVDGKILEGSNRIRIAKEPRASIPRVENEPDSNGKVGVSSKDTETSGARNHDKLVQELGHGEGLAARLADGSVQRPTADQLRRIAGNNKYMRDFLQYFGSGAPRNLKEELLNKLINTPTPFRKKVLKFLIAEADDEDGIEEVITFILWGILCFGLLIIIFIIYNIVEGKTLGRSAWIFMWIISLSCIFIGRFGLYSRRSKRWYCKQLNLFRN